MWRGQRIAAVIPAYNEERLIARTVRELPHFIDLVYVIDDASADGTTAAALSTQRQGLTVIRHNRNRGVGAATVTGYRAALRSNAELIVSVNGDAQMNPNDVEGLLLVLTADADLVRGNRFARRQTLSRMPMGRRLATLVLSKLTRAATGIATVSDSQCGFHALRRSALLRINMDGLWPRYGFPNDLIARAAEAKLRVAEVGVDAVYGDEQSGLHFWHAVHPVGTVVVAAAVRRAWRRFSRSQNADSPLWGCKLSANDDNSVEIQSVGPQVHSDNSFRAAAGDR